MSVSEFVEYLKGKSALMIYDRHPELGNKYVRDYWARGYYVSTIENVNEDMIRNYTKNQQEESFKESWAIKKPHFEAASMRLSTPCFSRTRIQPI